MRKRIWLIVILLILGYVFLPKGNDVKIISIDELPEALISHVDDVKMMDATVTSLFGDVYILIKPYKGASVQTEINTTGSGKNKDIEILYSSFFVNETVESDVLILMIKDFEGNLSVTNKESL